MTITAPTPGPKVYQTLHSEVVYLSDGARAAINEACLRNLERGEGVWGILTGERHGQQGAGARYVLGANYVGVNLHGVERDNLGSPTDMPVRYALAVHNNLGARLAKTNLQGGIDLLGLWHLHRQEQPEPALIDLRIAQHFLRKIDSMTSLLYAVVHAETEEEGGGLEIDTYTLNAGDSLFGLIETLGEDQISVLPVAGAAGAHHH